METGTTADPPFADQARAGGTDGRAMPSLEAVERRRSELLATVFLALAGLAVALVLLSPHGRPPGRLFNMAAFRVGLVGVTAALCMYVVDKERHLRRLTRELVDERVLTGTLSGRLKELATLLDVGKAVNSALDQPTVLGTILSSALELLRGSSGSIMLVERPDRLRVLCQVGNESAQDAVTRIGEGIAGEVAARRRPVLINGRVEHSRPRQGRPRQRSLAVESAMSVPLVNRDALLGVLNVNGSGDRTFRDYDLQVLTLFAEHAAISIANAQLREGQPPRP